MALPVETCALVQGSMVQQRCARRKNWAALALCAVLPFFLWGCGGGGGSSSSVNSNGNGNGNGVNAPEPTPVITSPPNIVAAAGVPTAGTASVTVLATPAGSARWGTALSVTAGTGDARVPVVATNASGQIVLAALASSSAVTLTADSTALALARFTYGRVPSGMDSTGLDAAIRATAGYATMAERVTQALAAGQASSTAPPVLQALGTVLAQTTEIVAKRVLASTRERPQAIASTRVSGDLPFTLVTGFGPLGSVYLRDSSNIGIRVVNTMPIEWAAQTYSATDQALAPKMATLPAASTLRALTNATGWLDVDPVVLPGHGGRGIDLLIEQNNTTRLVNWTAILTDAVGLYAGAGAAPSCVENVVNALLKGDELTALFRSASWPDVFKWLVGETLLERVKQALSATKTAASCFGSAAGLMSEGGAVFQAAHIKLLAEAGKSLDAAFTSADKVSLAAKVAWTIAAMTYSKRIGVCQSLDAGVWIISNCAKTFEFAPAPLLLAPGARLVPTVSALDVGGKHTGLPAGLVFDSPSSLISVDAASGKVMAGSNLGDAMLAVNDPAAGGKGELAVSVVAAQLQPVNAEMTVGETMRFALKDTLGRRIWHNGIEVQWASSAPEVASLAPIGRAPNTYPDSLDIDAKRPGLTRVEALNPLDPRGVQRATLIVKGRVQASLLVSPAPVLVGADTTLQVRVAAAAPDASWDTSAWPLPTGLVTMRNGAGAVLCTRTLAADATASCQQRFDTAATSATLSVDYEGDDNYRARRDAANTSLTIAASRVRLSASTSPNPSASGAPFTLSVSVSPDPLSALMPIPTGIITALNNRGAVLCQATLDAQGRASCVGTLFGNQGSEPVQVSYADSGGTYLPAHIEVPHQLVSSAVFRTALVRLASGSDCRTLSVGGVGGDYLLNVQSCNHRVQRVLQCSGDCFDTLPGNAGQPVKLPACQAGDTACEAMRQLTSGYRYWGLIERDVFQHPATDYFGKGGVCRREGWDAARSGPVVFDPAVIVINPGGRVLNPTDGANAGMAIGGWWSPLRNLDAPILNAVEGGVAWNAIGAVFQERNVETLSSYQFFGDYEQFYRSRPDACIGQSGADYRRTDVTIFDALTRSYRRLTLESSLP